MKDILSVAGGLLALIVILIMTYYASKWYAKRVGPIAAGRHIKVIDRIAVGKSASIMIIELEEAQYLVGISEHGVSMLKELDGRVSEPARPQSGGTNLREIMFRDVLGKYWKRKGNDL